MGFVSCMNLRQVCPCVIFRFEGNLSVVSFSFVTFTMAKARHQRKSKSPRRAGVDKRKPSLHHLWICATNSGAIAKQQFPVEGDPPYGLLRAASAKQVFEDVRARRLRMGLGIAKVAEESIIENMFKIGSCSCYDLNQHVIANLGPTPWQVALKLRELSAASNEQWPKAMNDWLHVLMRESCQKPGEEKKRMHDIRSTKQRKLLITSTKSRLKKKKQDWLVYNRRSRHAGASKAQVMISKRSLRGCK